MSKLWFGPLRFGHFCRFSSKLKSFESGSLWFQFSCHFNLKIKSTQIAQIKSWFFVIFLRLMKGKMAIVGFIITNY
ncbi:hypothetical protein Hanom_Chr10g00919501 [Helianthus anomalus]